MVSPVCVVRVLAVRVPRVGSEAEAEPKETAEEAATAIHMVVVTVPEVVWTWASWHGHL